MADQIVPFYLVVDENDPTRGSFVNGLNALPSVLTGLAAQYPVVDARTRLCKLGFGQGARVIRAPAAPPAAVVLRARERAGRRVARCLPGTARHVVAARFRLRLRQRQGEDDP